MRFFRRTEQPEYVEIQTSPRPGSVWGGSVTFTTDPHIGPPGYYALAEDGRTLMPDIRLTWVDEAPQDDEDGSGHFEVADLSQPYFSHMPISLNPNVVPLEVSVQGTSNTEVSP